MEERGREERRGEGREERGEEGGEGRDIACTHWNFQKLAPMPTTST